MAGWPFASVSQYNFDSGYVSLTTSYASVPNTPTGACWLAAFEFTSSADESVQISVKDGNGKMLVDAYDLPARGVIVFEFAAMPGEGNYQWKASLGSVITSRGWGWF